MNTSRGWKRVRNTAKGQVILDTVYRKEQLKILHDSISTGRESLYKLLQDLPGYREIEAKTELWLCLLMIKDATNAIGRPTITPDTENRIQHTPMGMARISTKILLLFSPVGSLLSFVAIAPHNFDPGCMNLKHIYVWQSDSPAPKTRNFVTHQPDDKVIAIIEKGADLKAAAETLVNMCFGIGGRSQHAPDLILVNEMVKDEFKNVVIPFLEPHGGFGALQRFLSACKRRRDGIEGLGALYEPRNGPSMCIYGVDAIDGANHLSPLAALYIFALPEDAKTISIARGVKTNLIFINQIPVPLLYWPRAPSNMPGSWGLITPYDSTLFSLSTPTHTTPDERTRYMGGVFNGKSRGAGERMELELITDWPG
ncbi:hypothetical protein OQA88_9517 [Cercophora sp. LCS_1]